MVTAQMVLVKDILMFFNILNLDLQQLLLEGVSHKAYVLDYYLILKVKTLGTDLVLV